MHVMWAHLRNMNLAERYLATPELAQAYAEHAPGLTLVGYLSRARNYAAEVARHSPPVRRLVGAGAVAALLRRRAVRRVAIPRSASRNAAKRFACSSAPATTGKCTSPATRSPPRCIDWATWPARWKKHNSTIARASNWETSRPRASISTCGCAPPAPCPSRSWSASCERPRHDVQGKAQVLFAHALQMLGAGHLDEAEDLIQEAIDVADTAGVRNAYTLPSCPGWRRSCGNRPRACATRRRCAARRLLRRAEAAARRAVRACRLCRNDLPHALRELGLDPGHARSRRGGPCVA